MHVFFLNISQERFCNGQITLHIEIYNEMEASLKKINVKASRLMLKVRFYINMLFVCVFFILFNKNKYSKSKTWLNYFENDIH